MTPTQLTRLAELVNNTPELAAAVGARDPDVIADTLNVRAITATPNPTPQRTITVIPDSVTAVLANVTAAEKGAIMEAAWATVSGDTYATHEAANDAVNGFLAAIGAAGQPNSVANVAALAIEHGSETTLVALIAVLVAAGLLSAESAATLQAQIYPLDPTWPEYIYEYGESIASAAGLPRVTPKNIEQAMNWSA